MTLVKAIIAGSAAATNLAKTMVTLPALIATDAPYFYIPLEPDSHQQNGQAEVSESLIISTEKDAKQYMSDNVAPGPWTWEITGYLPGNSLLEPTNLFTPILANQLFLLRDAFKKGRILKFKDADCVFYKNCVIQSLTINTNADCRNKVPISMTIKELNIAQTNGVVYDKVTDNSNPPPGSQQGETADKGAVASENLTSTYKAAANAAAGRVL